MGDPLLFISELDDGNNWHVPCFLVVGKGDAMKLAETTYDNTATGCCAPLDRERWDRQRLVWDAKPFYVDTIREFMHIPLNFGAVMERDYQAIEAAEAWPANPFSMCDELSPWRAQVYSAVDRDIEGAPIEHVSGTFLARTFEGPYRELRNWIPQMRDWVEGQGKTVQNLYFIYATCPNCAKKLGRNDVVLLAQVA